MTSPEISFEEAILSQIPEQKYQHADFASLPQKMRSFLHLLYPDNPRDRIAYIASGYYEQMVTSWIRGWVGIVQTQDEEGTSVLFIQWQPQQPLPDKALFEDISQFFKMLVSVLKPFFRTETAISLLQDGKESAIILAQGFFGSKPTHVMEDARIAKIEPSWPATLIWEHEFDQA